MVNHFTVTMSGSTERLSSLITASSLSTLGQLESLKFLSIQADPANTHVAYVGGARRTLTTTDYGYRIEIPVTNIPYAPTVMELPAGSFSLADIFILGTNAEKLHIFIAF